MKNFFVIVLILIANLAHARAPQLMDHDTFDVSGNTYSAWTSHAYSAGVDMISIKIRPTATLNLLYATASSPNTYTANSDYFTLTCSEPGLVDYYINDNPRSTVTLYFNVTSTAGTIKVESDAWRIP